MRCQSPFFYGNDLYTNTLAADQFKDRNIGQRFRCIFDLEVCSAISFFQLFDLADDTITIVYVYRCTKLSGKLKDINSLDRILLLMELHVNLKAANIRPRS
jgi:hypothetical protein